MASREIKSATKILNRMYKKARASVTDEQWQVFLDEIKQKQFELDGRVLEGAELEELARANFMARLVKYTQDK